MPSGDVDERKAGAWPDHATVQPITEPYDYTRLPTTRPAQPHTYDSRNLVRTPPSSGTLLLLFRRRSASINSRPCTSIHGVQGLALLQ